MGVMGLIQCSTVAIQLGWGACSLRACSDRLFEGLSLQAFFIVFGSLLDLQFGMFVSWFCCGIRMQSRMADEEQHARYKQQLI